MLAAQDGFPHHVQAGGRFLIGVGKEVLHGIRVSHDGIVRGAGHVGDDVFGLGVTRRIVRFPLLFRKVLEEGVHAFIHPGPLALVGVDDHGEEVMADFVNDDRDETVLGARAVSAIFQGTRPVETEHGVFHTAVDDAIDGDGRGIRISETVLTVNIEGMDNGGRGVLRPEGVGLLGEIGHGHDTPSVD